MTRLLVDLKSVRAFDYTQGHMSMSESAADRPAPLLLRTLDRSSHAHPEQDDYSPTPCLMHFLALQRASNAASTAPV